VVVNHSEWLEVVGLIKGVWPQGAFPDETVGLWYQAAACRWSRPITETAIGMLATTSVHLPTLAELVEARDAASRAMQATTRELPPPPQALDDQGRRWLRVIRAMRELPPDHPMRVAVREVAGPVIAEFSGADGVPIVWRNAPDGRTVEHHLIEGRWLPASPAIGELEGAALLDRLSALLPTEDDRAAHSLVAELSAAPGPREAAPEGDPSSVADVLAQWGADL
jgi:hypothetical protein